MVTNSQCHCVTLSPFVTSTAGFSATVTLLYPSLSLTRKPAVLSHLLCSLLSHFFLHLSSFIHFTVLAVNAINGFRFRCLNLAFSALCLEAARSSHLFLLGSPTFPAFLCLSLKRSCFRGVSSRLHKHIRARWAKGIYRDDRSRCEDGSRVVCQEARVL